MADWADVRGGAPAGMGVLVGTATSTVSGGSATVSVGGRTVSARALRGVTLSVNDPVLVSRQGASWWILGPTSASTPSLVTSDASPDPKPSTTAGILVVTPTSTGTYRGGEWLAVDSVAQGVLGAYPNATGAAFYGSTPAALKGATVTAATVQVRREPGGTATAAAVTLRLVTEATRPAGAPTLTSTATGPSLAPGESNSAFVVPTAWAQGIVDGTSGGLALFVSGGTPYQRYAGRSDWAAAWTLSISWTRS